MEPPATTSSPSLLDYYARRAREYERIYEKPERQVDLRTLRGVLIDLLRDRAVLEIACGTGYWTRVLAPIARSIVATDASPEVLDVARGRGEPRLPVVSRLADAYRLDKVPGRFDAAFAGFWWSHVPRRRRDEFLAGLHRRLGPGARVVLVDNRYVEGSSTPVAGADADGDTYQLRRLEDGSLHRVLKNFPNRSELLQIPGPAGRNPRITELTYYWCLAYELQEGELPASPPPEREVAR